MISQLELPDIRLQLDPGYPNTQRALRVRRDHDEPDNGGQIWVTRQRHIWSS